MVNQNSRLDVYDQQIHQLQQDVNEIKASLTLLHKNRLESNEFQKMGERLLLEADNSPDEVDSWMKFTHEEHSVMLQDLSKTHSTKVALNLWVFGKEAVSQLSDVEQ
ncbi:hypothetical protein E3N88_45631 [Mikania micrantha]|uniref:Uncharacterized protein n=1 Tax=Mikania micrantha TaxID=192012 RepID=A0A5N6L8L1_9ASTR|nr:hypothetical protein E3N88_45631 [Mikania micrantha]